MSKPEIIDTSAGPAQIKRSNRKTLAISVLPDGTLELVAPLHSRIETILSRIDKLDRRSALTATLGNRRRNRRIVCGVRLISGTSTIASRPCATTASIALRYTSVLPLPVTP